MPKPVGSGKFAVKIGGVYIFFAIVAVAADFIDFKLPIAYILALWFAVSGIIAIVWGQNRIATGDPGDGTIGMETINMLVTMLGVAFAIAALGR